MAGDHDATRAAAQQLYETTVRLMRHGVASRDLEATPAERGDNILHTVDDLEAWQHQLAALLAPALDGWHFTLPPHEASSR